MATIATRGKKQSAYLAWITRDDQGYCRKDVNVAFVAGMENGSALLFDGVDTYNNIAAAATVDLSAGIAVIDDVGVNFAELADGDVTLSVIFRGPCGLNASEFGYADTLSDAQVALVEAQLEVQGIQAKTVA